MFYGIMSQSMDRFEQWLRLNMDKKGWCVRSARPSSPALGQSILASERKKNYGSICSAGKR